MPTPQSDKSPRFKQLLRARLDELDMSPRDLALRMDINYALVRLIARGQMIPSIRMAEDMASALSANGDGFVAAAQEDRLDKTRGPRLVN
jgi:ribosome-binding protein aMBF1 (putative translation factor)